MAAEPDLRIHQLRKLFLALGKVRLILPPFSPTGLFRNTAPYVQTPAGRFNTSVRIPRQQHAVLVMEQKAASKDNQNSDKAAEIPKGFESEVSQPCGILFAVDW